MELVTLSKSESDDFSLLECQIERGLSTFIEVGNALTEIRDRRLYRSTHATFEDYCRQRWDMTKTSANRLIAAAEVMDRLTPIGVKPSTESQVRELAKLPDEQQAEAWRRAVEESSNGKPTAAKVAEIVEEMREEPATRLKIFDIPSEVEAISRWLGSRRESWPEDFRHRFVALIRFQLDFMEDEKDDARGSRDGSPENTRHQNLVG